jgi:hypothetical protein
MSNELANIGQKESTLMKAGDGVRDMAIAEFGAMFGGAVLFAELSQQFDAKRIQAIARIKKEKLYTRMGFKTWDECCSKLLGPKRTMDRKVAELEIYGPDYFGLRQIVRIGRSVYELMDVQEGHIIHDGERIPIDKAHEGRITEIVGTYKARAEKAETDLADKKREADELRTAKNNASKAAEKARQEFIAYRKAQAERWPNVYSRDLNGENQARYIGLTEYMYRQLIQATFDARDKYGVGWNMAEPAELLAVDHVAPNASNLIEAFTKRGPGDGKNGGAR